MRKWALTLRMFLRSALAFSTLLSVERTCAQTKEVFSFFMTRNQALSAPTRCPHLQESCSH